MTDTELNSLIRKLGIKMSRDTVRSLLAGNDMQCFTTEQYRAAYERLHKVPLWPELTRKHLEAWNCRTLREVRPDVWIPLVFGEEIG